MQTAGKVKEWTAKTRANLAICVWDCTRFAGGRQGEGKRAVMVVKEDGGSPGKEGREEEGIGKRASRAKQAKGKTLGTGRDGTGTETNLGTGAPLSQGQEHTANPGPGLALDGSAPARRVGVHPRSAANRERRHKVWRLRSALCASISHSTQHKLRQGSGLFPSSGTVPDCVQQR